jgi:hypothetical protein
MLRFCCFDFVLNIGLVESEMECSRGLGVKNRIGHMLHFIGSCVERIPDFRDGCGNYSQSYC